MLLYLIIIAATIAVICIIIEIYRELNTFRVVTYEINSPKIKGIKNPIRIVFLSDLHNHMYKPGNEPLINSIKETNPDLVLIGGDMLVGKRDKSYQTAVSFMKEISKSYPVYYANGNHEQRAKEEPENYRWSYKEYKEELENAGVIFLENASTDFLFENFRINITGLEIPGYAYTHFKRVQVSSEEIEERIGRPEKQVYQILLAHNPIYMEKYIEWGADLILSGHLHGGIVRIPGITGLITPAFRLFPKYSGEHRKEGDTDIVVSKGLGVHTVYIRFLNPAEVVLLNIKSED